MRTVTFNALALQERASGVQTYIRELLCAIGYGRPADILLQAHVQKGETATLPVGISAIPHRDSRGSARVAKGTVLDQGPGVYHGLNVELPFRPRQPLVATIHDLAVLDTPWAFPRWRVVLETKVLANAMRRADELIAVSRFTADRIKERYGRNATVTVLAPRPGLGPAAPDAVDAVRTRHRLPDRFVLHLGTVEPRKNTRGLAQACADLRVPLVLAGAVTLTDPLPGEVLLLGYVPDADIAALFGAATVVGYPSSYEGFGLPPIEAMACGAPVVATAVGALPEVLNEAVPLAPVGDQQALVDLLGDVLGDDMIRASLAEAGRGAVAALDWSDTARRTMKVYDRLW